MTSPTETHPTPRRWRGKALLAGVSFLLTLGLCEAASYLVGRFPPPSAPLQSQYLSASMRQYDHLLFWSLRPGAKGDDGEVWINSDGLRGPEIEAKRPGEYRVLSLGESTTFAKRMDYAQCYSARIEEELGDLWQTERPIRVINAGVPGYSLFQGYQYLAHRGLALDPDMVLVYFGHNDSLPVSFLDKRASAGDGGGGTWTMNDRELYEARQSVPGKLNKLLTDHSNAYRGLLQLLLRGPRDAEEVSGADPDAGSEGSPDGDDAPAQRRGESYVEGAPPRVPAEDRRAILGLLRELCAEQGITLVLVIPWYRDRDEHAPLLREFAAGSGVPVVDLPEILAPRLRRERATYFSDSVHPIPEGHALIADAILEVLAGLAPAAGID